MPRDFAAMVETIHPEERASVMAQFWAAASTATTFRFEFRLNSDVRAGLRQRVRSSAMLSAGPYACAASPTI